MKSMYHIVQITKDEFYALGGFANPYLFRKSNGESYTYWKELR